MLDEKTDEAASMAQANALLAEAGWQPLPKPCWAGGFTMARQVGGVAPDGTQYVKGLDIILPGHPDYGPDTPDEFHEAAAWLIAFAKARASNTFTGEHTFTTASTLEPIQLAQESEAPETPRSYDEATADFYALYPEERPSESDSETGEASGGGSENLAGDDEAFTLSSLESGSDLVANGSEFETPEDALDADFEESPLLGAELLEDDDFALAELPAPEPEDFAPEEIEEAETPTDRFYGLDDLDRRRNLRIGDVVQISLAKQEAIWAEAHASENEFMTLTGFVLRDTVNGQYIGDSAVMRRFNELQQFENKATAVRMVERSKVLFLRSATHPELEAFDPAAGWP